MSMSQQKSNGASATSGHSNGHSNGKASNGKRRRGRPPRATATRNHALSELDGAMERFGDERRPEMLPGATGTESTGPRAELTAMQRVYDALEPFDQEARARVLDWASVALGLDAE
jgi:hypothetical protein